MCPCCPQVDVQRFALRMKLIQVQSNIYVDFRIDGTMVLVVCLGNKLFVHLVRSILALNVSSWDIRLNEHLLRGQANGATTNEPSPHVPKPGKCFYREVPGTPSLQETQRAV